MNYPSITKEDIRKAASREDLIRDAAAQIIKDFAEFDLEIRFSGNIYDFYQELFSQMQPLVDNLLSSQGEKFFNLLYRIDVDPKDIEHYQQEFPETSMTDVITELIIHREIKKVMIREFFRQSNH